MGNVQMEADQIRYKDSSGTYRNVQTGLAAAIAGGGGGSSTLAGLTDTSITTPSDGQVLTYDSTAEKWENAAIPAQSIDGLSDTTITTPSDGQVLTYDATAEKWENATPASGVTTLAALTDTAITTPSDGQVLTYDATAEKWVNASGGSGGGGEVYPAVGTEVKIGTWRGQDLYRQVFCGEVASNTSVNVGTIDGSYYITNLYGSYSRSVSSGFLRYNFPDYTFENSALSFRKLYAQPNNGSYEIKVNNNASAYIVDLEVVVEYTKIKPPQPTP